MFALQEAIRIQLFANFIECWLPGALTIASSGDVTLTPATDRSIYFTIGGTTVFTLDDSKDSLTIDTSDIDGTTTIKGSTTEVASTSHTYISAGDSSNGDSGDITMSQVFYGLSETRMLVDTDGAVYINPEPDMGVNLFTTSSYASDATNAMYAVAGSNSASGLSVVSGQKVSIVDVALDNYRGCLVEILFEVVFDDGVIIGNAKYMLHYSGTATSVGPTTTSMTAAYSSYGSTLTFGTSVNNNVFTVYATYARVSSAAARTGKAYSLVEIKGGYKSYAIYSS